MFNAQQLVAKKKSRNGGIVCFQLW